MGFKGKSSRSEASGRDLSGDGQAPSNEIGNGLSATRDLRAAAGLSWAEGAGTMERDSICEGLNDLAQRRHLAYLRKAELTGGRIAPVRVD